MGLQRDRNDDLRLETPDARFLRSATLCRTRDLEQIVILGELVKDISELIHALQKERGASSIYLGSNGAQFSDRLAARIAECRALEQAVREGLAHVDEKLDRMSSGARFYTRVALAFRALDTLPGTRQQIAPLALAPQDAVKTFTEIIGCLLAVGFEVADIAASPTISRALIALVNFAQGKEYAGQERATVGAAFSRGHFLAADQRRLQHLVAAQEQAFRIFAEFSDPLYVAALQGVFTDHPSTEVKRMRTLALSGRRFGEPAAVADAWFEQTTRRIDAMKTIADQLAAELGRLCAVKLAEARSNSERTDTEHTDGIAPAAPVAMLVTDVDPALNNLGLGGGVGLYTLDSALPMPMRSIIQVVQAQSRRIDDVSNQLASARMDLLERKVIERAKGLLMKSQRLSEKDAYALIRETAMNRNKRIFEVAEAIVSTAEFLKA
ncbi:MAG: nitrate- and nitrite sensing domain-containing protein [Pseudomonadota bacterium]|nr:nitrate- and nitrite sensing domain-containing protein [Pseudomonadota bacterium]